MVFPFVLSLPLSPSFYADAISWRLRSGRPYPPEFRHEMVRLVRAGRNLEELAKEYEPSSQTIRNWVAQADRDEGRREDGLASAERDELRQLRRENRRLREEREILKKAAAWFAQESGSIPSQPGVDHALEVVRRDLTALPERTLESGDFYHGLLLIGWILSRLV